MQIGVKLPLSGVWLTKWFTDAQIICEEMFSSGWNDGAGMTMMGHHWTNEGGGGGAVGGVAQVGESTT